MAQSNKPSAEPNVVRLLSREEAAQEDRTYWHSKTPLERLAAGEELRQIAYGTIRFMPELKRILNAFNSTGVEYLLIGDYANIYHGARRMDREMDVWISLTAENASRVEAAIRSLGYNMPGMNPEWFLKRGSALRIRGDPWRFDIVNDIDGVTFTECYSRRIQTEIDGVPVNVISLADLKKNKKATGRLKDLSDLEYLP